LPDAESELFEELEQPARVPRARAPARAAPKAGRRFHEFIKISSF
jgi:hypothetical protein